MKYKVRILRQPQYQDGGDAQGQLMQVIQAYAQAKGIDPQQVMQQLQQMQPEQQKQALQQMYAELQGGGGQEEQAEMAYGGQMPGYGLDLGSRSLWMNQNNDQEVTDTIQEVPRNQANIEAEKGETALMPMPDGTLSHKKIGGRRHTEGGTPLNVPEGTFIFSDTKRMKIGGDALKMFGKPANSGKKYTPADLAKQYPIDKYKAIINDPKSDAVQRRTAELMIQNYQKKLAQLALVQEGKKGYPQGIPQIAQSYYQQLMQANQQEEQQEPMQEAPQQEMQEQQAPPQQMMQQEPQMRYGGYLQRYQSRGEVKEYNGRKYNPAPSDFNPEGWNVEKEGRNTFYSKDGIPGSVQVQPAVRGKVDLNSWMGVVAREAAKGATLEEIAKQGHIDKRNINNPTVVAHYNKYYKPAPGTDGQYYYQQKDDNLEPLIVPATIPDSPKVSVVGQTMPINQPSISENEEYDDDNNGGNKTVTKETNYGYDIPDGWTTPDKMNLMNSLYNMASIKRQMPWEPAVKLQSPEFTYADPSRALAANMEAYNSAARNNAMFANPQSRYSLTGAAGQAASQAANIIGQYSNQNLGQANQAAATMADMMNKQSIATAERAKRLYDAGVIGQQQYQNAMRAAKTAALQAFTQGYENASKMSVMNRTESPYYYIDPRTGKMVWNSATARQDYFNYKNRNQNASEWEEKVAFIRSLDPYISNERLAEYIMNDKSKSSSSKNTTKKKV